MVQWLWGEEDANAEDSEISHWGVGIAVAVQNVRAPKKRPEHQLRPGLVNSSRWGILA